MAYWGSIAFPLDGTSVCATLCVGVGGMHPPPPCVPKGAEALAFPQGAEAPAFLIGAMDVSRS